MPATGCTRFPPLSRKRPGNVVVSLHTVEVVATTPGSTVEYKADESCFRYGITGTMVCKAEEE